MIRIGVGQADFHVGDPTFNLEAAKKLLVEAENSNIDVLVLPELANSGYTFEDREEARACSEAVPNGPFCRLLANWSDRGRMVVSGLCEQEDNNLYNTAVIFGDGDLLGCYRKLHLFNKEHEIFLRGEAEPPVITFQGYRFGIMVCFDWVFPEIARILALKEAQIILHPSNLVLPYGQAAMVTRSLENRVFTATANRTGTERGLRFTGLSQITSPHGEVLIKVDETFAGIIYADLDLTAADNKLITPFNDVIHDRRPSYYHRLVD